MQGEMHVHFSCVLNSSIELSNIVMTLNCCDNQVQTVDVIILANTTNGTVTTLDGKLEGTCAEQPLRLNTTNPVFVDNIDIDIQIQTTVTNDQKECFEIPFNAVELFQGKPINFTKLLVCSYAYKLFCHTKKTGTHLLLK